MSGDAPKLLEPLCFVLSSVIVKLTRGRFSPKVQHVAPPVRRQPAVFRCYGYGSASGVRSRVRTGRRSSPVLGPCLDCRHCDSLADADCPVLPWCVQWVDRELLLLLSDIGPVLPLYAPPGPVSYPCVRWCLRSCVSVITRPGPRALAPDSPEPFSAVISVWLCYSPACARRTYAGRG